MDWSRERRCIMIGAAICLSGCLLSCRKHSSSSQQSQVSAPTPPDLSGCTRVETRYLPSTRGYFLQTREDEDFVNPEDFAHLFSQEVFVIDDRARVEALARKMMGMPDLDRSTWIPGVNWVPKVGDAGRVTFYRGSSAVASFTVKAGGYVVTEDGKWFFSMEHRSQHCGLHARGAASYLAVDLRAQHMVRRARLGSVSTYAARGGDVPTA